MVLIFDKIRYIKVPKFDLDGNIHAPLHAIGVNFPQTSLLRQGDSVMLLAFYSGDIPPLLVLFQGVLKTEQGGRGLSGQLSNAFVRSIKGWVTELKMFNAFLFTSCFHVNTISYQTLEK